MSKKLAEKQQRRLAEERRRSEQRRAARRRNGITAVITLVVVALVVGLIMFERGGGSESAQGVAAGEAGCGEIEEFDNQGRDHISVGATHDPYNSSPPTSGPHYDQPATTGFYTDPLEPEQLVHNLEHGMIVIWYDPGASQTTLDQIEALVDQEREATVAAPYDDIDDRYNFVLTAWQNSQGCARVSQEVVDDFRRELQGQGPERIAPPFTG